MDTGDILLKQGVLSAEQLAELRGAPDAYQNGWRLDLAAIESGHATEEEVLRALGNATGVATIDLDHSEVEMPSAGEDSDWLQVQAAADRWATLFRVCFRRRFRRQRKRAVRYREIHHGAVCFLP